MLLRDVLEQGLETVQQKLDEAGKIIDGLDATTLEAIGNLPSLLGAASDVVTDLAIQTKDQVLD